MRVVGVSVHLAKSTAGRKVLIAHNVDSLIWQRYHEVERSAARRWYIRQQWKKFQRFERRAFRESTRVVAVSAADAALLREQFGVTAVDVVDNGVDPDYFHEVRGARNPYQVLFLGALDWRPNQDAVRFLLDEILPLTRAREPRVEVLIVGRNPPAWLIDRVSRCPRVHLQADVPDVRPYLAASSAMLVPLRIGGGSRLKILEALASGLPVISTRVGAEGLCLEPGRHWLEANTAEELAETAVDCLARPEWAQQIADQGRQVVREHYDWGRLADRLEQVWYRCVSQAPGTRRS